MTSFPGRPRPDPSAQLVVCEAPGCPAQIPLSRAYSMAIVYRMPGPGKLPYQCPYEQHFACCHAHAKLAALACLQSHIEAGDYAGKEGAHGNASAE